MLSDHITPTPYVSERANPHQHESGFVDRFREALRNIRAQSSASQASLTMAQTVLPTSLPNEEQDWPSLDVVYDETKGLVADQNDRLKNIDTKANFGLGAATLLTAGVTGLGRALADTSQQAAIVEPLLTIRGWQVTVDGLVGLVTILSLGLYAAIAFTTYLGYRIRPFQDITNATKLMETYIHKSPEYTKAVLAGQRAKNYTQNEARLASKATWVERSMRLLVGEALLLFVIAVIQVAAL